VILIHGEPAAVVVPRSLERRVARIPPRANDGIVGVDRERVVARAEDSVIDAVLVLVRRAVVAVEEEAVLHRRVRHHAGEAFLGLGIDVGERVVDGRLEAVGVDDRDRAVLARHERATIRRPGDVGGAVHTRDERFHREGVVVGGKQIRPRRKRGRHRSQGERQCRQ
jgi:hypothetical protein